MSSLMSSAVRGSRRLAFEESLSIRSAEELHPSGGAAPHHAMPRSTHPASESSVPNLAMLLGQEQLPEQPVIAEEGAAKDNDVSGTVNANKFSPARRGHGKEQPASCCCCCPGTRALFKISDISE